MSFCDLASFNFFPLFLGYNEQLGPAAYAQERKYKTFFPSGGAGLSGQRARQVFERGTPQRKKIESGNNTYPCACHQKVIPRPKNKKTREINQLK
jgi:hypothetical protein